MPKGFNTFIEWHGRGDYDNYILSEILKSYAYDPSNKEYDFLRIKKELTSSNPVEEVQIAKDSLNELTY